MQTIETPRLIIRKFSPDDWQSLKALIVWYNSSHYAVYDHRWPTSDRKIKDICRTFVATDGFFAVCLKDSREFVGYISLTPEESDGVYNLGYCFQPQHHGNGYAFESCLALFEYAFNTLDASKIVTGTAAENADACKLLNKLGMEMTGSSKCSFYRDQNGRPIEFMACRYELSGALIKQSGIFN